MIADYELDLERVNMGALPSLTQCDLCGKYYSCEPRDHFCGPPLTKGCRHGRRDCECDGCPCHEDD